MSPDLDDCSLFYIRKMIHVRVLVIFPPDLMTSAFEFAQHCSDFIVFIVNTWEKVRTGGFWTFWIDFLFLEELKIQGGWLGSPLNHLFLKNQTNNPAEL